MASAPANFHLRRFGESRSSSGSTPSIRRLSVRLSIRNNLGCLVCVICNSKSFLSFLFKFCILIVHIFKVCTFYFVHTSQLFFSFLGDFPSKMLRDSLVYVIRNSKSFHYFLFQLCIMVFNILKMSTFYFLHISRLYFLFLRGAELRHFSVQNV